MLKLTNISFAYPNQDSLIKAINLDAPKPEIIAVIGESGSGKSTLLKLIYGLLQPSQGEISWHGKKLLGPNYNLIPGENFIKFVGQDFNLNSPLSALENISTHLRLVENVNKEKHILELLNLVGLEQYKDLKVNTLSFGQQQRVALAKALAKQPQLLLLDEPFSNIDYFRKNFIRRNLFSFLKKKKITTLISTHDKEDILSFSDRCVVLKDGCIIADKDTGYLYDNPKTHYIASFFDDVNILDCNIFELSNFRDKSLLVYPNEIEASSGERLKAKIEESYFKGNFFLYRAVLNDQNILFESPSKFYKDDWVDVKLSDKVLKNIEQRIVDKKNEFYN